MATRAKPIYQSKTFYFGLLWVILGVANVFGFGDYQPNSSLNEFSEIANGVLIVGLRYITDKPVTLR